LPFSFYLAGRH